MIRSRLQLLENEPPIAVESILKGALDHAEPNERTEIAELLVHLKRPKALSAVIGNMHRLEKHIHQKVCDEDIFLLIRAANSLADEANPIAVENLLDIAEHCLNWRFLPLLAHLLTLNDTQHSARSSEVMLSTVVELVGDTGRRCLDPDAADTLDEALFQAGESYRTHRQNDVLLALALIAMNPGPRVSKILAETDHPATLALRGIVEKVKLPLVRRNLLRWLPHRILGPQSLRWMHRLDTEEAFTDLLKCGHLLRTPSRRYALRRIDRPMRCIPDAAIAAGLPESAQASLPHLINAVGLSTTMRIRRLADCVALRSPLGRLRATQSLAGLTHQSAIQVLLPFTRDGEPVVASIATATIFSQPTKPNNEIMEQLIRRGHQRTRHQARLRKSGNDTNSFFSYWMQFSPNERWTLARYLLVTKRLSFLSALEHQLKEGDRATTLAAISLARRLNVIENLESVIISLIESDDAHIASASIAALGQIPSHTTQVKEVLRVIMHKGKGRSRANAVEVLLNRGDPIDVTAAENLTESRENRLRANAVRGIVNYRPQHGAAHLKNMLHDTDPLHRISGLWVTRRTECSVVKDDVHELAAGDDALIIRKRASTVERILTGPRRVVPMVMAESDVTVSTSEENG